MNVKLSTVAERLERLGYGTKESIFDTLRMKYVTRFDEYPGDSAHVAEYNWKKLITRLWHSVRASQF